MGVALYGPGYQSSRQVKACARADMLKARVSPQSPHPGEPHDEESPGHAIWSTRGVGGVVRHMAVASLMLCTSDLGGLW